MVVGRRHLEPVVEESRHDRIDFFLQQHKAAHHDVVSAITFGHGEPSAKAEGSGHGEVVDGDVNVISRNIDLQHIRPVVA